MPRPNKGMRVRGVRFTDEEWAEIGAGALAHGETRSEAIRAGALGRLRGLAKVREAITKAVHQVAACQQACVYCKRFTDMQDSLPVKGGGSAHASCAMRASLGNMPITSDEISAAMRKGGAK